jgi:hypothetical protein
MRISIEERGEGVLPHRNACVKTGFTRKEVKLSEEETSVMVLSFVYNSLIWAGFGTIFHLGSVARASLSLISQPFCINISFDKRRH